MLKKKNVLLGTLLVVASCALCTYTVLGENEHALNYDFDGGEAVEEYVTTATFLDEVALPKAEKEHYVLQGYDNGTEVVTSKITHVATDLDLKAVWNPEVYTVEFYDGDEKVSATNYAYGSKTDLNKFAEAIVEKHPYEDFKGWTIDEELKNELSEADFGNKTAVAKFEGKTYSVTYETNGGTTESANSYKYGEGLEFQDATRDGYTFDGWFSDEACTNKVESIDKSVHEDMTLYAGWTEIVVERKTSTTRSSSSSRSSSATSSAVSTGWNTSVGATLPRLGYHVDNVSTESTQAMVDLENTGVIETYSPYWWANDSDNSFACYDAVSGQTDGIHRVESSFTVFRDHAGQGLSSAGDILQAGDVFYLNGRTYTYSGEWYYSLTLTSNYRGMVDALQKGYTLALITCSNDNTTNYVCFFY